MERKIKFEFWDKEKREMWKHKTGKWYVCGDRQVDISYFFEDDIFIKRQFTGSLAKNKIEIYDDDIIKYKNEVEEEKIVLIEWDCSGWWTSKGDRLSDLIHNQTIIRKEQFGKESMPEKIGNIYENPNLTNQ